MRIAVVGAGISGLACSYFLSRRHEVRLFEKNDYFGGHSNTVTSKTLEEEYQLDTGFVVYNEAAYPLFSRLLEALGVRSQASDMSFSVTCDACDLAYSSRGLRGFLASGPRLLRPSGARFLADLWRFFRAQRSLELGPVSGQTLRTYLTANGFGSQFERHFLVPLASAVWSTPPGGIDGFPATFFLQFLQNHGLIGTGDRWRWRTITGGSRVYVNAILKRLGTSAINRTPVSGVRRSSEGIRLSLGNGERCDFDAVVFACHADEAAALLQDGTSEEREALACFTYNRNRVVLHTDEGLLPRRRQARASWNYATENCRAEGPLRVTYHLNRLQGLEADADFCVTVNPPPTLRRESILRDLEYDHPAYTFETLEGQSRLAALNGRDRVYYAGAHLGYGFHEDGVASAARVAALLGVEDA